MAVVVPAVAGVGAAVFWLRRRFLVVTVRGWSMAPTYRMGDRLLVRRAPVRALRAGDIVVINLADSMPRPAAGRVVKRVVALPGDPVPPGINSDGQRVPAGKLVILGDNPAESVDSRHYGYVPVDRVLGMVLRLIG